MPSLGASTGAPSYWDWYNSYLFAWTIISFTGMWWHAPATPAGQAFLFVYGLPALVLGIMCATVMARVLYLCFFARLLGGGHRRL